MDCEKTISDTNEEATDIREWRWHVPFITGVSTVTVMLVCGMWSNEAISASLEDGKWVRMVHIGFLPIILVFMMFSFHTIANSLVSGMGPIAHLVSDQSV